MDGSHSLPAHLDANIGAPLLKFIIACMVLQTFFVLVHVVARILRKSSNGPETWFILSGYFFNMAFNITGILEVKMGGLGRHIVNVLVHDPETLWTGLKIMVPLNYTYLFAVTLPRLGILCFYFRIFKTKHYPKIIYLSAFILIANLIVWVLVLTFMCKPFAYNWDKTLPEGRCTNQELSFEISGFPNVITDVIMLAIPLPVIWKLHASTARKIGLMVTFWTGSIGTVCAVLRLYGFFRYGMFEDLTYNSIRPMAYSVAEGATYLMAAIFLTLGPLLRDIRQRVSSVHFRSYIRRPSAGSDDRSSSPDEKSVVAQVVTVRKVGARFRHAGMLSYLLDSTDKSPPATVEEANVDSTPMETEHVDWPFVADRGEQYKTTAGEV